MMNPERRRHARESCLLPVRFTRLDRTPHKPLHIAKSKNVSQGGMKITAMSPPEPSTFALVEVDLSSMDDYVKEDELLAVSSNRILAEVVWRKLNLETGLYEAGLKFIEASRRDEFRVEIELAAAALPRELSPSSCPPPVVHI